MLAAADRTRPLARSRASWALSTEFSWLRVSMFCSTLPAVAVRLRVATLSATIPIRSRPSSGIQARPRVRRLIAPESGSWRTATAVRPTARGIRCPPGGRDVGAARRCGRRRGAVRAAAGGGGGAHQDTARPSASLTAPRRCAERERGLRETSSASGEIAAPGQQLGLGLVAADADRQLRRADAAAGALGEEPLQRPVLERVEADRRQPPPGPQQLPGLGQPPLERVELPVDRDPDRLEGALRRVAGAEPRRGGHPRLDRGHQLRGGSRAGAAGRSPGRSRRRGAPRRSAAGRWRSGIRATR